MNNQQVSIMKPSEAFVSLAKHFKVQGEGAWHILDQIMFGHGVFEQVFGDFAPFVVDGNNLVAKRVAAFWALCLYGAGIKVQLPLGKGAKVIVPNIFELELFVTLNRYYSPVYLKGYAFDQGKVEEELFGKAAGQLDKLSKLSIGFTDDESEHFIECLKIDQSSDGTPFLITQQVANIATKLGYRWKGTPIVLLVQQWLPNMSFNRKDLVLLANVLQSYRVIEGREGDNHKWLHFERGGNAIHFDYNVKLQTSAASIVVEETSAYINGKLVLPELRVFRTGLSKDQVSSLTKMDGISCLVYALMHSMVMLNANADRNEKRKKVSGIDVFRKLNTLVHCDETPHHIVDNTGARQFLLENGHYLRTIEDMPPVLLNVLHKVQPKYRNVPVAQCIKTAIEQFNLVALPKKPFQFVPMYTMMTDLGAVEQSTKEQILKYLGKKDGDYVLAYMKASKLQQGPRLGGAQALEPLNAVDSPFVQFGQPELDRGVLLKTALCPYAINAPGSAWTTVDIPFTVKTVGEVVQYDMYDNSKGEPLELGRPTGFTEFKDLAEGWNVIKYDVQFNDNTIIGEYFDSRNSVVAYVKSLVGGQVVKRPVKAGREGMLEEIRWRIADQYGQSRLEVQVTMINLQKVAKLREWDTKAVATKVNHALIGSELEVELMLPADCFKAGKNRIDGLIRFAVCTAKFNEKFGEYVAADLKVINDLLPDGLPEGALLQWNTVHSQLGLYEPIINKFRECFYAPIWLMHPKDGVTSEVVYEEHKARGWAEVPVPDQLANLPNVRALAWLDADFYGIEGEQPELLVCWSNGWAQRTMAYVGNNTWGDVYCTQKVEYVSIADSASISQVQAGNIVSINLNLGKEEAMKQVEGGDRTRALVAFAKQLCKFEYKGGLKVINLRNKQALDGTVAILKPLMQAEQRNDIWQAVAERCAKVVFQIPTTEDGGYTYINTALVYEMNRTIGSGSKNQLADLIVDYFIALCNGASPLEGAKVEGRSAGEYSTVNMLMLARRIGSTLESFADSEASHKLTVGGPSVSCKVMAHPQLAINELAVVRKERNNKPAEGTVYEYMLRCGINFGTKVAAARAPMPHVAVFVVREVYEIDGVQHFADTGEELLYNLPDCMVGINPIAMAFNRGDFDGDPFAFFKLYYQNHETLTFDNLKLDLETSIGKCIYNSGQYWSDHFGVPGKIQTKKGGVYSKEELVNTVVGAHEVLTRAVGMSYNASVHIGIMSIISTAVPELVKISSEIYEALLGGYSPGGMKLKQFFSSCEELTTECNVVVQTELLHQALEEIGVSTYYANEYSSAYLEYVNTIKKFNESKKFEAMKVSGVPDLSCISWIESMIRGGKEPAWDSYNTTANVLSSCKEVNIIYYSTYKACIAFTGQEVDYSFFRLLADDMPPTTPPSGGTKEVVDRTVDVVSEEVVETSSTECKENAMIHKVMLCGSRSITVLPQEALNALDKIMSMGAQILVGDCPGVDHACLEYLWSKKYKKVSVWHKRGTVRYTITGEQEAAGWTYVASGATFTSRDVAMFNKATSCLAVWDGISKGTMASIDRFNAAGKYVKVVNASPTQAADLVMSKLDGMAVLNGYKSGWGSGRYIGRPSSKNNLQGSVLANPYKIGQHGNRQEVVQKYEAWLKAQIDNNNKAVIDELLDIYNNKLDVVCYCAPELCHGNIVVKYAQLLGENQAVEDEVEEVEEEVVEDTVELIEPSSLIPDFLSEEQKYNLRLVLNKEKFIKLLGKPGTGKSTVIKQLPAIAKYMNYKLVVCASTGIAATLLSQNGIEATTTNSRFSLGVDSVVPNGTRTAKAYGSKVKPTVNTMPGKAIKQTLSLKKKGDGLYDGLIVVIDEVSMHTAPTILCVMQALEANLPGRYVLILAGDPKQLGPVFGKVNGQQLMSGRFWEPATVFDDSTAEVLGEFESVFPQFVGQVLTKVHRTDNQEYIDNLNLLGNGICTEYFTKLVVDDNSQLAEDALHIFVSNAAMIAHNKEVLQKFPADQRKVFVAQFRNKSKLSDSILLNSIFPVEVKTELAIGSKFMVRKNLYSKVGKLELANGTIGIIREFITHKEHGDGVVLDVNGVLHDLFPTVIDLPTDADGNSLGYFKGLPGHLAYAVTGHKCQGMSLSAGTKVVVHPWFLNDNGKATKAVNYPGWLYVVLSRNACIEDVQVANDCYNKQQAISMLCSAACADEAAVQMMEGVSKIYDTADYKAYIKLVDVIEAANNIKFYKFDIYFDYRVGDLKLTFMLKTVDGVFTAARQVVNGQLVETDNEWVQECLKLV